jgi:hypothetical protein
MQKAALPAKEEKAAPRADGGEDDSGTTKVTVASRV